MSLFYKHAQTRTKKILGTLCIVLIFASANAALFTAVSLPAHAQTDDSGGESGETGGSGGTEAGDTASDASENFATGVAACGIGAYVTGLIQNLIGGDTVPVDNIKGNIKECLIDGFFRAVALALLNAITNSIVDWILTGFDGSPAFVTNLEEYLLGAANEVIGEYIYGSDLGFLCSPFELDVRLALALEYQDLQNPVECRLTDVIGNVEGAAENFFAGDFRSGGWPVWINAFMYPQNNPAGAVFIAAAELEAQIATKEKNVRQEISYGDGFRPFEKCETVAGHPGLPEEERCTVVTPGKTISEHLSFELTLGEHQLLKADEIGESVDLIIATLAQKAFSEASEGLLGLAEDGTLEEHAGGEAAPAIEGEVEPDGTGGSEGGSSSGGSSDGDGGNSGGGGDPNSPINEGPFGEPHLDPNPVEDIIEGL